MAPNPKMLEQGVRRREAIVDFIREYRDEHGYSPSLQELQEGPGPKSPTSLRNHLDQLVEAGVISMTPKIARSIVLLDG